MRRMNQCRNMLWRKHASKGNSPGGDNVLKERWLPEQGSNLRQFD